MCTTLHNICIYIYIYLLHIVYIVYNICALYNLYVYYMYISVSHVRIVSCTLNQMYHTVRNIIVVHDYIEHCIKIMFKHIYGDTHDIYTRYIVINIVNQCSICCIKQKIIIYRILMYIYICMNYIYV